jgi:hypothetical protein
MWGNGTIHKTEFLEYYTGKYIKLIMKETNNLE